MGFFPLQSRCPAVAAAVALAKAVVRKDRLPTFGSALGSNPLFMD
jgi:hypothetical protein